MIFQSRNCSLQSSRQLHCERQYVRRPQITTIGNLSSLTPASGKLFARNKRQHTDRQTSSGSLRRSSSSRRATIVLCSVLAWRPHDIGPTLSVVGKAAAQCAQPVGRQRPHCAPKAAAAVAEENCARPQDSCARRSAPTGRTTICANNNRPPDCRLTERADERTREPTTNWLAAGAHKACAVQIGQVHWRRNIAARFVAHCVWLHLMANFRLSQTI